MKFEDRKGLGQCALGENYISSRVSIEENSSRSSHNFIKRSNKWTERNEMK